MPCSILLILASRRESDGSPVGEEYGKRTGEEEGSRVPIYSLAGRHSGLVVAKGGEGRWCSGLRETDDVISADHGDYPETFENESCGACVSSDVHFSDRI